MKGGKNKTRMKKQSEEEQESQEEQRPLTQEELRREFGYLNAQNYYAYQDIRIKATNRIRNIVYRMMNGLDYKDVQDRKPDEEKYLKEFTDSNLPQYIRILYEENIIDQETKEFLERNLETQKSANRQEKDYQKLMKDFVEQEPIYEEFLSHIRGISQTLSAQLINKVGYCEHSPYVSSLWTFFGYHVKDGKAPRREAGKKLDFPMENRTIGYNISDMFVKHRTPFYREIYDQEKERQINMLEEWQEKMTKEQKKELKKIDDLPKGSKKMQKKREFVDQFNPKAPVSKMNADLRARRKAVKIFLSHYFVCAKELTNQEIPDVYPKEKLGHRHITHWKEAVEKNLQKVADDKVESSE